MDGQVRRCQGTWLWHKSWRNLFASARKLKAAINFPGQKHIVISRLKIADLRVRYAVGRVVFTDDHHLYCLAFVESSVDCQGDRVISSDRYIFSSASDGLVLVYRPWGELQLSGCVSLHP
jgi:hypothetical protein